MERLAAAIAIEADFTAWYDSYGFDRRHFYDKLLRRVFLVTLKLALG